MRAHHEEFINELIDNFGYRKKILLRKNSMTNSSTGPIKASKSFLLCIYDKRPRSENSYDQADAADPSSKIMKSKI